VGKSGDISSIFHKVGKSFTVQAALLWIALPISTRTLDTSLSNYLFCK
jgi:hypothetical protein